MRGLLFPREKLAFHDKDKHKQRAEVQGMGQSRQRALVGALLLGSSLCAAAPAPAFSIFGIRLWGEEPSEEVEVINPLPYTIDFTVRGADDDLADAVRNASSLWNDRENPASGRAGLIAKARGDYRRILAALYNAGHYGPEISIRLAGQEAAELTLAVDLPPEVPVTIDVVPGPQFRFGVADIVNAPPWTDSSGEQLRTTPDDVGFAVGEPAEATAVARASDLAIARWRSLGHPKAEQTGRDIIADHATRELEARITLDPGRRATYGPVTVAGTEAVDRDFVAYMSGLRQGRRFRPEDIERAQDRLVRLGTFNLVSIDESAPLTPDGQLPLTLRVEDRLPRRFGIGATISTLDGLGIEGFWLHRNLFGRAEQLRFDANIARIGAEDAPKDLTYQAGVTFVKPGVINPDTSFVTSLIGRQEELETYRERALTFRFGLLREFGREFTGEIAFEVTRSRVEDEAFGVRNFLTLGPVARGQYDRRDDPVDPTEGFLLAAQAGPFYETEFGNIAARGTLEGRAYHSFDDEGRFVLAFRGQVGTYVGPDAAESPPGRLFFAGGGGSVRGYAYRSIGIDVPDSDDDVGGRSLIETSGEIRARIGESFGVVAFLDGGYVAEDSSFGGDGSDWRLGAGLGLRYYTGFGPLRVDVATPLNPRDDDSAVALYIGIGQAF